MSFKKHQLLFLWGFSFFSSMLFSCSTTTQKGNVGIDRSQYLGGESSKELHEKSLKTYQELITQAKRRNLLDKNKNDLKKVKLVLSRLVNEVHIFREEARFWNWEVHIITADHANAYCLPGGKIIIYSGLLKKINPTDSELAALIGHEISHALREHGQENKAKTRLVQKTKRVGLALLATFNLVEAQSAIDMVNDKETFLDKLVLSPYQKIHEYEADKMGLELMARAGYPPAEAIQLWDKISAFEKNTDHQLLSTHPNNQDRRAQLLENLPLVNALYEESSLKKISR
jgi:Zn-dependent protease with chaperone function